MRASWSRRFAEHIGAGAWPTLLNADQSKRCGHQGSARARGSTQGEAAAIGG